MSVRILSLDTTSATGGIALIEDGEEKGSILLESPDGFAHVLFAAMDELLKRHGWKVLEIDCFAAAAGPGSFTGVRVGLAAVKGLAAAAGKPVCAVSNLQAMAWFGEASLRAPLIDARRGEVYAAVYDAELRVVRPETVGKLEGWLETLPQGAQILGDRRWEGLDVKLVPPQMAGAAGRIAYRRFVEGQAVHPALADANYVRRSDAELFWKE